MDRYNAYLKGQLAELIGNYGPLGILWFDGEWESPWNPDRAVDLYRHCRQLQPSLIINNRVGKGRQDMAGTTAAGAFAGDYDTPEQRVGKFQIDRPWESCITICQQWAWKPNDPMKSLKECLQTLVTCAGGDGNLLLNVGPMPDGRIEPRQVERLEEMGRWLRRYGKTVYATRGGPFKPGPWGVSTHRERSVYVHVLDWHDQEAVRLPALEKRVLRATALTGGKVVCVQSDQSIELRVPAESRSSIDTVIQLQLDGPASELSPR
jgi:alpha-L-fucosidase